jgi:hypothetical protein
MTAAVTIMKKISEGLWAIKNTSTGTLIHSNLTTVKMFKSRAFAVAYIEKHGLNKGIYQPVVIAPKN